MDGAALSRMMIESMDRNIETLQTALAAAQAATTAAEVATAEAVAATAAAEAATEAAEAATLYTSATPHRNKSAHDHKQRPSLSRNSPRAKFIKVHRETHLMNFGLSIRSQTTKFIPPPKKLIKNPSAQNPRCTGLHG